MTTRDDVFDAIDRIEKAGCAGEITKAAKLELLMFPPDAYNRILDRLRSAFPKLFPRSIPPPDPASGEPPEQQGVAAQAMKKAEIALAQQQSAIAEFDRRVIEALLHAHQTTRDSRRLLDDLESQIDGATRTWDLSSAAGAREFQRFLIAKLSQIIAVVEETSDDDTAKQALAAAWAALYASETDQGRPAPADPGDPPPENREPNPDPVPGNGVDPYLDTLPPAGPEFDDGEAPPARGTPNMPTAPTGPGLGGELPGVGAGPAGGAPGLLPLANLLSPQRRSVPEPYLDGQPDPADDLMSGDDVQAGEADDAGVEETGGDEATTPESSRGDDPAAVTLPGGERGIAASPQLAAVMRAAVGGTPIADAFRQQGIAIPPPGTPVTGPVDQSRVSPGDIGMCTDRHAMAVGSGEALLDGQIQDIANVRGPSFLGWQRPPMLGEAADPPRIPTPTRPSARVLA